MITFLPMVICAMRSAIACQKGEVVEARWRDGSYKEATILEVRDEPGGKCGHYRLAWHHTHVCEQTNHGYWGDDRQAQAQFCLVSRDAIRKCKQELCGQHTPPDYSVYAGLEESESSGEEEDSDRHVAPLAALAFFSLAFCCICLRRGAHHLCQSPEEVDEEKGMDAAAPVERTNDLWALTPKVERQDAKVISSSPSAKWAMNSSPMAKWLDKHRKRSGFGRKTFVQPQPAAAEVAAASKTCAAHLQTVDHHVHTNWHGQVATSSSQDMSSYTSVCMSRTQGTALRQAAWVHTTPLRLPLPPPQGSVFLPSSQGSQLPTLLQHPIKTSLRKKPPLQGVPPQEPSRKGPGKHVTWDQAAEDP